MRTKAENYGFQLFFNILTYTLTKLQTELSLEICSCLRVCTYFFNNFKFLKFKTTVNDLPFASKWFSKILGK